MKIKLTQTLSIIMLFIFSINNSILNAQTDSSYFYLGGIQEWFYQQKDVYQFRLSDKSEFMTTLPSTIVERQEYAEDGMNYIYFKNTASTSEIQSAISTILADPLFEKEFMVLTKDFFANFDSKKFIPTNENIEIVFNNENITLSQVNTFATNHFLKLVYTPPFSNGVYIFKVNPEFEIDNLDFELTLKRAREIWEQDMAMVSKVSPSLGIFNKQSTNDSRYDKMWHVEHYDTLLCNGTEGYASASAKINTVWNRDDEFGTYQGYTGIGITVAVIDADGYQYSHPDMQGVYLPGKAIFSDTIIHFNSDYWYSGPSHGHAVSSIIAAKANNNLDMAGVAYNAKIKPYLLPNANFNFTDVLNIALMECMKDSVDVINMSLALGFGGSIINASHLPLTTTIDEVYKFKDTNDEIQGIPMIAGAGNGNGYNQNIPALYTEVLSVGGSTPKDRRKQAYYNESGFGIDQTRSFDGFDEFFTDTIIDTLGNFTIDTTYNPAWGSSYFIDMDVVAPCVCIPALNFYFNGTYSNTRMFSGTSASAPIVSGIAALLLEKDPSLTAEQVYNAIRNGAEKTGGYVYSDTMAILGNNGTTYYYYTANPKHVEMGYGRVNAYNTVFNTDTTFNQHLDENDEITAIHQVLNEFNFYFNNPAKNNLNIKLDKKANYDISIFDLGGKLINTHKILNDNKTVIPVTNLSKGLYFMNIYNAETKQFAHAKFVKQ